MLALEAELRFHEIYDKGRSYTMTSVERLYALFKSVEYMGYIVPENRAGDIAQARVRRGGSRMLVAETLLALGDRSRRIFLFDTFAGHPRLDGDKGSSIYPRSLR